MAQDFHHSISTVDPEIQRRAAVFATQLAELVRKAALEVVRTTLRPPNASGTRGARRGPASPRKSATGQTKRTATARKATTKRSAAKATKKRGASRAVGQATSKKKTAPKKKAKVTSKKKAASKKKAKVTSRKKTAPKKKAKVTPRPRRAAAGDTKTQRVRISKKVAAPKSSPPRRNPRGLDADVIASALLKDIKKSPGRGIDAIAESLGVSSRDLKGPIKALLQAGRIRAEGSKRSTKYLPG